MSRRDAGAGEPAGLLLVDKPAGPTSHDIVALARRALGVRRVGHTGTLDPFASGLLLLAVGRATRLVQYMDPLPKTYEATARLGEATTTDDPEGEVVQRCRVPHLGEEKLRAGMAAFMGRIRQRPPAYSAKKVGGVPAHRRARRGEDVQLAEVEVEVHELELLEHEAGSATLSFRVRCSTGTYVRSLARDLALHLGTCAHLTLLRRTAIGPWSVDRAVPGGSLERGEGPSGLRSGLVTPLDVLSHLPRLDVDGEEALKVAYGQRLSRPGQVGAGELCRLAHRGELLAVAEGRSDGLLHPRKVFQTAEELADGRKTT
ncbi:MAG: tRNA pseudouridine(55) synthase TruB [Gemmatimonadales bacterium]|nr:MAG: tRNA pseudouridine(55) synthase TruB [Gemmatimonadales bacterium]